MTNHSESPASPDRPHGGASPSTPVTVLVPDAVAALGRSSADYDALSDEQVLAGQALIADSRRALETCAAWMAATLARRSRAELGGNGLAARHGFRTPEDLLQSVSGSSKGDAVKLLGVGRLLAEADAAEKAAREAAAAQKLLDGTPPLNEAAPDLPPVDPPMPAAAVPPWHAPIGRALREGWLSVEKADSLRKGLGDLDRAITPEKLATALARLLTEARTLNTDQLFKRARRMRDVLDEAGIAAREKAVYDDRSLRFWRLHTGQVRMVGLFAPEDGEYLMSTYDAITSPRRGGVRFVDKEQAAWAKRVQDDPRTTEQLTADAFLALMKLGVKADPKRIAGGRSPAVRMITIRPTHTAPTDAAPTEAPSPTADAAANPETAAPALQPGVIEGTAVTVSAETLERNLCDTGILDVTFDDHGHGVDLGREQRTFSPAQRAALSLRDGGCMWPGCDRPPSWTETHHIHHWKDNTGQTNLDQGILLCRSDHLRLHNEHWRITRDDTGQYWLTPPPGLDPEQKPIPLTSKNALTRWSESGVPHS
ncbi:MULTISPECIES: HNH endonuclease signature motif containing protein [unclassified Cryobacterium]|uniref:HNH endonuclease signature motif containing protein n=2 Tax=Cryobacterium TaxID=69578 RepID=UPI00106BD167|nr:MULTISPECIES: HNH endonuclease signature motif containing protein [unclassified Cryobacterium]TFB96588.1 HNH endonuclease [Cryobacterium sp. MDB2-A-1]TFC12872.1 HNH endonuclease [Cryobacterium sp. MDB2-A-2]